jgi:hypothetical protein
MAAKDQAAKAGKAAQAARDNPYLQRLAEDPELRENIRSAYDSARSAYTRLSNGKAPAQALLNDKKLQKELKEAASSLRDASEALREGPKRKRKRRGRKLLLLLVAAGVAVALSEGLRKKVLDTLFGAEEEFEYTSTTTVTETPQPAGTAN